LIGTVAFEGLKIAGALHSLYFIGRQTFLGLYFDGRRIQNFLFWKWLLRFQRVNENDISDKRFKYLMYLANDQDDRSVFGGLGSFDTVVAGVVSLTFVQKIQDPISELKAGPQHSICILM
jgi:hypothetical protein